MKEKKNWSNRLTCYVIGWRNCRVLIKDDDIDFLLIIIIVMRNQIYKVVVLGEGKINSIQEE